MEKDNSKEIFEQDLHEHFAFDIDVGQEPLRIDKFLMDRIPNISRNKIQIAAHNGNILVNKLKVKPNYKVKPKDIISIVLPYPVRELELKPQNIPVDNLLNLKLDLKLPFLKLIFLFPKLYSELSRSNPLENNSIFKKSLFNFVLNLNFRRPLPSKFDFIFAIISLLLGL